MRLTKLVRTASSEANALAISAGFLLLVKILLLNRFPGWFFGAYELGIIVEAVLASVLASYVFYLLVVRVKEESDRDVLRPYLEKHSRRIVGECISQVREISKASGITLDFTTVTASDVKSAFSAIAPYSPAPLVVSAQPLQHANWLQYFEFHNERSKASIRKLFDQLPFLDPVHVSVLTDIDDCAHFAQMRAVSNQQIRNTDLSVFSGCFHEYCVLCQGLNKHLANFGMESIAP